MSQSFAKQYPIDTDPTLAGDSDYIVPSQSAVKAYVDANAGGSAPVTTAANDFQVGDGLGAWVKKTLAETITIIRTSLDSIYAALVHTHAASDVTSGTMETARLGSGTANSSSYLRGDQTWATIAASGLTISSASVTTSNVSGVEGTLHNLDVSGMTANRDFNLPTPSAAGVRCGVHLSVGDATYALLMKINSSEWSRIFITGEIVIFVATGTGAGDWAIEEDGRIPCVAQIKNTGAQNISHATLTLVVLDEASFDNASIGDTTNYRLTARRENKYIMSGFVKLNNISAAAPRVANAIKKNGSTYLTQDERSASINTFPAGAPITIDTLAVGDYISGEIYQNSGATQATYSTIFTHLEFVEVLT